MYKLPLNKQTWSFGITIQTRRVMASTPILITCTACHMLRLAFTVSSEGFTCDKCKEISGNDCRLVFSKLFVSNISETENMQMTKAF